MLVSLDPTPLVFLGHGGMWHCILAFGSPYKLPGRVLSLMTLLHADISAKHIPELQSGS